MLEAQERAQSLVREQETSDKKRSLVRKRQAMEAQIAVLRAEFGIEEAELKRGIAQADARTAMLAGDRIQIGRLRLADAAPARKTAKHN